MLRYNYSCFCPGTLTSITNFASSVSRNMERLSFDVDHIQRNEILRRQKPSHVSEGLRNGLSGLGLSILGMFSLHFIFLNICSYVCSEKMVSASSLPAPPTCLQENY